jgi:hypothetical protein
MRRAAPGRTTFQQDIKKLEEAMKKAAATKE